MMIQLLVSGASVATTLLFVLCCSCAIRQSLASINFTVVVTSASQDAISYDTGNGVDGETNHVEVRVFDHCKFASSVEPTEFGAWYPQSIAQPLVGITTDVSGITGTGTGPNNVIGWGFDETIETNTNVYTRIDEFNAELKFCVRILLLTNNDIVNWDELDVNVPIEYSKPMIEEEEDDPECEDYAEGGSKEGEEIPPELDCPSLEPDDGSGSGGGSGGGGGGLFGGGGGSDGGGGLVLDIQTAPAEASYLQNHTWDYALDPEDLNSYFCNEQTHQSLPPGSSNHQGKAISICFDVKDGTPFEVEKVLDLFVYDAAGSLHEVSVFENGEIGNTYYALQYCETNKINSGVRTCVAQFMLAAVFYDYEAVVLRGYGSMLLRLEDRRHLLKFKLSPPDKLSSKSSLSAGSSRTSSGDHQTSSRQRRQLGEDATAGYQVQQQYFKFDERDQSSSSSSYSKAFTTTLWGSAVTVAWFLLGFFG